ncbi:MAG: hypothetical protein J5I98_09660 [Phaeodactylibacter sp.]|nr:hypothetical protein [Phaeodactylibacter sp.]
MNFLLDKKGSFFLVSGFFLLIILLLTKLLADELSTSIVLSAGPSENIEEIIDQIIGEKSTSSNKNKPDLKEEIEHAKSRLSKNDYKAAKSNYKRLVEHVDKLDKYKQNPLKYDNQGFLKNAPNEQVRQKIIQSRIAHLEQEIQTFYNNIIKIIS